MNSTYLITTKYIVGEHGRAVKALDCELQGHRFEIT